MNGEDQLMQAPEQGDDYATPSEGTPVPATAASVIRWTERIRKARAHWDKDFKRMRENMEFAAGFQWEGQMDLRDPRYIANMTLRMVNQKVASLYARDPKVVARRVRRLDFQIWDGKMETLQQAAILMKSPEAEPEDVMQAAALVADFTMGRQQRDMVDRVGQTMEHLFSWMVGNQMPTFKVQAKQLVRRVVTAGVGYLCLDFARSVEGTLSTTDTEATIGDRVAHAQNILQRLSDGEITQESPEIVDLQALMAGLTDSQAQQEGIQERLVFDFPPPTSIIVDPACRTLKGFVGAKWVAQEYLMSVDEVNQFFETNIKYGGDVKEYNLEGVQDETASTMDFLRGEDKKCMVCLWKVYELATKSCFVICDGWKDYVSPPEPVYPETKHFWPIFPLTFNDVEVEPGHQKASIFPPSDIDIIWHPQKEWNRTRNSLRLHRNANKPKYVTGKGWLTDEDKQLLQEAPDNAIIELQQVQPTSDVGKLLAPFQHSPIDPTVYDTSPLNQDMFTTLGNEEATQPASSKSTATAATINEQSRLVVTSSNVDDLDDFLTDIAEAGGEVMLRELSLETVQRIAGVGAVWPEGDEIEDFINFVHLQVVAASSGRPNKALEISNFVQLAPILLQAGVNAHFLVREAIKRLDDRLDIDEAFQLGPAQAMSAMPIGGQPQQGGGMQNPPQGTKVPSQGNQMPGQTQPKVNKPQLSQ